MSTNSAIKGLPNGHANDSPNAHSKGKVEKPVKVNLGDEAQCLIESLTDGLDSEKGSSSMTPAIYDTAWASMVFRQVDDETRWIFPESFHYILDTQLLDGGWVSYYSEIDGILNTMAALLSLKSHESRTACTSAKECISSRVLRAVTCLQAKFESWDVESSIHVGFEILVPALLVMLEKENIFFNFPGRQALMEFNQQKMKDFNPKILYGKTRTTLLHSLEAFIGKIDFDKVKHHLTFGSMMGSPSSTAAYLMNISSWDDEAEAYIRGAMSSHADAKGALPSAFPINIFEISWVLSTVLQSGYSAETLGAKNLAKIAEYLERHLKAQDHLLGFAPQVLEDADDTARAILTLNLLGKDTSPDCLLSHFTAKEGHIQTYVGERNSSFSANCNVLQALLHTPDPSKFVVQISTLTTYLCDAWWDGELIDKWNLAPEYSMMLLSQAFMRLLKLRHDGTLRSVSSDLIKDRVAVVLMQISVRLTIRSSEKFDSAERLAYTLIAMTTTYPLFCGTERFGVHMEALIRCQIDLLEKEHLNWTKDQFIWVEKVSYGSKLLSKVYCLAALNISHPIKFQHETLDMTESITGLFEISPRAKKLEKFFTALPNFNEDSLMKEIEISIIEGLLFLPQLKRARTKIFPVQETSKDTYLEYIPITWVLCNTVEKILLDTNIICDMMEISMLDFLVDEYMEAVVAKLHGIALEHLADKISLLCGDSKLVSNGTNGIGGGKPAETPHKVMGKTIDVDIYLLVYDTDVPSNIHLSDQKQLYSEVTVVIANYIDFILNHPMIKIASPKDQQTLRKELRTFLIAHLDQLRDNTRFLSQTNLSSEFVAPFLSPRTSYHVWAHTTAAEHISCPFSFAFYSCLIASSVGKKGDCFSTGYQKYLAQEVSSHLAIMSRMYNDFSSVARDRDENNLNSLNFPEFHPTAEKTNRVVEGYLRRDLLGLADYEKACSRKAGSMLQDDLRKGNDKDKKIADAIKLFVSVTELYAEMYVAKDLTNRVK